MNSIQIIHEEHNLVKCPFLGIGFIVEEEVCINMCRFYTGGKEDVLIGRYILCTYQRGDSNEQ